MSAETWVMNSRDSSGLSAGKLYTALWNQIEVAQEPPDIARFLQANGIAAGDEQLEVLLIDQRFRWRRGCELSVEQYLELAPEVDAVDSLKVSLIVGEFEAASAGGRDPSVAAYLKRFPYVCDLLLEALRSAGHAPQLAAESEQTQGPAETHDTVGNHHGTQDDPAHQPTVVPEFELPERFGRYQVRSRIGGGGFGHVFLAFDAEMLDRYVAIKVPREDRLATPKDRENFIKEAKLLAGLKHPKIVTVYDSGRTEDGGCFVVSEYIDGNDLADELQTRRLSHRETASIVADVAEALHYAHGRQVVHRDVKPANILLDRGGSPYLADFGIALQEADYGQPTQVVGTFAYMSPEQSRGEGHLIDGRSDIYSLGIVLYECLAGRRPFPAQLLDAGPHGEVRPLRQIDDTIPRELDRICQRALAERASDRYATADDMAADLRGWLAGAELSTTPTIEFVETPGEFAQPETAPIRIVPKGLRSFDVEDSDFFLSLIPGVRDRDGLPDSVRFWRTRIESRDADASFRVGLIYGPSGCGKSSFLRAGLVPRLRGVRPVVVECSSSGTEAALAHQLRKACPWLPEGLDLVQMFQRIRRGDDLARDSKVLIVLDQFEQWLHAHREEDASALVNALRQCDGTHIQCLISVRDDFWMGVTQFLHELEVELYPDRNVAALQLFSRRHALKILTAFGRAFGALPEHSPPDPAQNRFLKQVVDSLAEHDHVIPVRLALLAEMIKDKDWDPHTLEEIGGLSGIGVAFLEETFSATTAMPEHRMHARAARRVLKTLLPEEDGSIKGDMRSREELLAASGYGGQITDFNRLMGILDHDLRLITPTQRGDEETQDSAAQDTSERTKYYHLTHDYLVPSLREWLTEKQKETLSGRAELRLAEYAAAWQSHATRRNLPSWWEWLGIVAFVPQTARSQSESRRKLMAAATQNYVTRGGLLLACVILLTVGTIYGIRVLQVGPLVDAITSARLEDIPNLVDSLGANRAPVMDRLHQIAQSSSASPSVALRAKMALLSVDSQYAGDLRDEMLTVNQPDVGTLVSWAVQNNQRMHEALPNLEEDLWQVAVQTEESPRRRLRAAAFLAALEPGYLTAETDEARRVLAKVADELVREITRSQSDFDEWVSGFDPIREGLREPLSAVFRDDEHGHRETAAGVLAAYFKNDVEVMVDLLLDATPAQHDVLTAGFSLSETPEASEILKRIVEEETPDDPIQRNAVLKRRAHGRALLVLAGEPDSIMPVLDGSAEQTDPTERTYLVARLSAIGVQQDLLAQMASQTDDPSLKASLLTILGGMRRADLPNSVQSSLIELFADAFSNDPHPAVHSAAEWALRDWDSDNRLEDLKSKSATSQPVDGRDWYVTSQGQTMVLLKGPVDVKVGSPEDEAGRDGSDEMQVVRHIDRSTWLSTTEVTDEQFLEFFDDFRHKDNDYTTSPQCPAVAMNWNRAVQYCVWLSKVEGIPDDQICYHPQDPFDARLVRDPKTVHRGGIMVPYEDYLNRTGYRLPSEVEWEYACRAGSETPWSWGTDPEMADRYAWHAGNSKGPNHAVGTRLPNGFGFFDMHGNVSEWMHEAYPAGDPTPPEHDLPDLSPPDDDNKRINRSGTSADLVRYLRSANRNSAKPISQTSFRRGFRIARTHIPSQP